MEQMQFSNIPLKEFIEILISIYQQGIDFIDIIGKKEEGQDSIWIIVNEPSEEEKNIPSIEEEGVDFNSLM